MPKFIVVSGEPRSGTSMMMQTLNILGMKVWDTDKERNKSRDADTLSHAEKLNPKGYLETPFVTRGINLKEINTTNRPQLKTFAGDIEKHDGEVVKIITRGLMRTDLDIIDKIIFCTRHPYSIAYSQTELATPLMVAADEGKWEYPALKYSPLRYIVDISAILKGINIVKDRMIVVDYNDMHNDTKNTIKRVCEFLKISPDEELIKKAIENVDPKLNRKSNPPPVEGEPWKLAEKLYQKLIKMETIDDELLAEVEKRLNIVKEENASWFEESIWTNCDISLYKKLQENGETKRILERNAQKRCARGMTCTSCKYYNRNGKEQIIRRSGIGDLVDNTVDCSFLGQNISIGACQSHWNYFRTHPDQSKPKQDKKLEKDVPNTIIGYINKTISEKIVE